MKLILELWIYIAVIAVVSIIVTGVVLKNASDLGLIATPGERSSHTRETPFAGGIGFVITSLLSIIVYLQLNSVHIPGMYLTLAAAAAIAAIGLWDDMVDLSAALRLLSQIIIVGVAVWYVAFPFYSDNGQSEHAMIYMAGYAVTVLVISWWLNVYNFMDGIDGIAATELLFLCLACLVLLNTAIDVHNNNIAHALQAIAVFMSASVAGFLVFNWPPARIFMGDVGSTFLGFMLGMLALTSILHNLLSVWSWLIIGGIFWVDAMTTLLRRIVAGEKWYRAHRNHAYQHAALIMSGKSNISAYAWARNVHQLTGSNAHRTVCIFVLIINVAWLLPAAYISARHSEYQEAVTVLSLAPLAWIALRLGAGNKSFLKISD